MSRVIKSPVNFKHANNDNKYLLIAFYIEFIGCFLQGIILSTLYVKSHLAFTATVHDYPVS